MHRPRCKRLLHDRHGRRCVEREARLAVDAVLDEQTVQGVAVRELEREHFGLAVCSSVELAVVNLPVVVGERPVAIKLG